MLTAPLGVHLTDVCRGKGQCANFIGFRKKFDSARLDENFTAFIFCMNNFCCGSKYTESKVKLKRSFITAGGKGTTLEKPKNESSPKNLPIPRTEVVFINWK